MFCQHIPYCRLLQHHEYISVVTATFTVYMFYHTVGIERKSCVRKHQKNNMCVKSVNVFTTRVSYRHETDRN